MSSTSQLTTFSDLYTDLGNRLRLTVSHASTLEQLKRYINVALHDMHLGLDYKLPWCERRTELRTKAPYSTGTVSISVGSTTLTGSGTTWNTANSYNEVITRDGGKVVLSGGSDIYTVTAVGSDTSLTLDNRYVGSDALSGASYTYFENEYSLSSSFLRPIDVRMFSPASNIALISRAEFRRRYTKVAIQGRPQVACIIDSTTSSTNSTPARKILFYPYPDQVYIIPYAFITATIAVTSAGATLTSMSSDDDVPTMPLHYRHAIVLHALAHWYRDKKDDARADVAKAEYTEIMSRIVNDHDIATHTRAQIQPSIGSYVRAAQTPYSRRGGRRIYDLNDDFDSFRR
jgi:hypothetical protein